MAGLAAGGEVVETGGFTMDRAHALAKLEGFQLRDPALAVARVLEATHLLRGTMRAMTTPWGFQLLLHRVYLSRRECSDLMLHALDPGASRRSRALHELAVGMLASRRAARRPPLFTSTDTEGCYRARFGADHTAVIEPVDEPWRPTSIAVARFLLPLPTWFREPGDVAELDLLRLLAHWSSSPVFVDDRQVNVGLPLHVLQRRALEGDGIRGVVGLRHPDDHGPLDPAFSRYRFGTRSTLHVLSNGVHIQAVELPAVPPAVVGVIDLQALTKDASHERIVADARFATVLDGYRDQLLEYGVWLAERAEGQARAPGYSPERLRRIGAALSRLPSISP